MRLERLYFGLHVDAKNIWIKEWYERLGFKELSRDENEIEMIKEFVKQTSEN